MNEPNKVLQSSRQVIEHKLLVALDDPDIGKWHGIFPRKSVEGYKLGSDGFLYTVEDVESGRLNHRMEHQGFTVGDA